MLLSGICLVMASSLAHAQSVTPSPASARPQAAVTVPGRQFADSDPIDVYVDTVDNSLLVSSTGTFSGTVTVPAAAATGTHYITAIGRRSGDAAQGTLTVTTPWVEFAYGAGHLGWNSYKNAVSSDNVAPLGVLWNATVNGLDGTPAVGGGKAFFGTNAGIRALSTTTGAVVWTEESNDQFYASPAVAGDVVYAVGYSGTVGTVYALAASKGDRQWATGIDSSSYRSPVVGAGVVYVVSQRGTVYALQATNGNILWNDSALCGGAQGSPAVASGTLYIPCSDDEVYALNAETGAVKWKFETAGPLSGSSAVSDGVVHVGSSIGSPGDGNVYAIRTAKRDAAMALRFHFTPGGSGTPAVAHGNVYIVADGVLYALDAKVGKMNWYSSQDDFQNVSVANGVVYASARSETLYAFDANLGGLLASWNTGYDYPGGPAISDGTVHMNGDGPDAIASSLLAGTGAVQPNPALTQRCDIDSHVVRANAPNPDQDLSPLCSF